MKIPQCPLILRFMLLGLSEASSVTFYLPGGVDWMGSTELFFVDPTSHSGLVHLFSLVSPPPQALHEKPPPSHTHSKCVVQLSRGLRWAGQIIDPGCVLDKGQKIESEQLTGCYWQPASWFLHQTRNRCKVRMIPKPDRALTRNLMGIIWNQPRSLENCFWTSGCLPEFFSQECKCELKQDSASINVTYLALKSSPTLSWFIWTLTFHLTMTKEPS